MEFFMLKNKVGLVTGGSSGIGYAVALVWVREGAKVVVSDTDIKVGEETASMLRGLGGDAIFISADVGDPKDSETLVKQTVAHYGRLDLACNNAGVLGASACTADYPLDDWARVIQVNLSGVIFCMQQQIGAMLKTGGGSIVNMASIMGQVGYAMNSAYTAAKHGVVGLTQAAALEYSAQGLRINAVGPGFIHTTMVSHLELDPSANASLLAAHPIGRLGHAEEVAELVAWLSSDRASFVTGAFYPVDGGYLAR
jgi:NAD(P)-dependent dehydrogenase (short-subunit alcohol dehydrogenase family)